MNIAPPETAAIITNILKQKASNRRRRLLRSADGLPLPNFGHFRGKRRRRRNDLMMSGFEDGDLEGLYFRKESSEETEDRKFKTHPSKRKKRKFGGVLPGNVHSVEKMLKMSSSIWDFNAFTLDRLSYGDGLASLCTYLFHRHGLLSTFGLDPLIVWKFFSLVESGYRDANPYHNGVHATDVTQAMNLFLQEPSIKESLSPLELMGSLIAAATHDLDHPGQNERFLISTKEHLASLYYEPESGSLLENHHWRSALSCMHESGLAQKLDSEDLIEITELIRGAILATDISKQGDYLFKFTEGINNGAFSPGLSTKSSREFIIQIAMKCADISNPCRAWNVSRLWSYRASEEFFRQGDKERELGLAVTPLFDRLSMTVAKIQTGFYRIIAQPLFEEWNRYLSSPLSNMMLHNLVSNHARWDLIIQQERSSRLSVTDSITSSTSSSSASSNANNRRSSMDPRRASDDEEEDEDEEEEEEEGSDKSYPYLPLDSSESAAASTRRRFSLPLSPTVLSEEGSISPAIVRCGNKRRLFTPEENSEIPSHHKVTFHLGNSLDETCALGEEELILEEEDNVDENSGPNKVPKIFHENKENSASLVRRGSAPSELLLNQIASSKKKHNSASSNSKRDVSPGAIINSSKDPIIVKVNYQRHSRLLKIDRRRGSLPVFSSSDFRRVEGEFLQRNNALNRSGIQGDPKRSSSCSSSSSSSSKRTSSSSSLVSSNNNNTGTSSSRECSMRRKILRRKSGGSETLLHSSSNLGMEKAFLRRGSLRLGDNRHRHIVVSQETLLDELIKFSSVHQGILPTSTPRVQILRGLSPSVESELLQKFRNNLALNASSSLSKRTPLQTYAANNVLRGGRRGSLPSELLSFV